MIWWGSLIMPSVMVRPYPGGYEIFNAELLYSKTGPIRMVCPWQLMDLLRFQKTWVIF